MFDLFSGLPVHILVVHAVVVLAPIAAVCAIVYALRPTWRRILAWPIVVLSIVTGITGFVAGESGEALESRVQTLPDFAEPMRQLVEDHASAGDTLKLLAVLFMVITLVAVFFVFRSASLWKSPNAVGATAIPRWLQVGAQAVLIVISAAVFAQTVITGHTGATAAWKTPIAKTHVAPEADD